MKKLDSVPNALVACAMAFARKVSFNSLKGRKTMKLFGKAISIVPILLCGISMDVSAADLVAVISIDKTAQIAPDKLYAMVTATYSCGPLPQPQSNQGATFASIDGTLSQASGRNIAQGQFFFSPLCDGETQQLAVGVQPTNIPWHGGNARVDARLFVQECDQSFVCESAQALSSSAVKIQGGSK